jgi:hypothetical protein
MDFNFNKGFIVYKSDKNPDMAIVCPHSGPALLNPTYRDDNSETVGSHILNMLGGKLVISNMPRSRWWGIDFNRDIPDENKAIEVFKIFQKDENSKEIFEYRQKYAWVAKNEEDYYTRLKIYQNFWSEIDKSDTIILLHRSFPRIKSLPSLMDFILLGKSRVKPDEINEMMKQVNSDCYHFLKKADIPYKKMIAFESERVINNVLRTGKQFDVAKLEGEQKANLEKDMEKIEEYADEYIVKRLKEKFTPQNYLAAVNSTLKNAPLPEITFQNAFDGSLSLGPKRKLDLLRHKIIVEVEPSRFMNFWYPHTAAKIIKSVMHKLQENVK